MRVTAYRLNEMTDAAGLDPILGITVTDGLERLDSSSQDICNVILDAAVSSGQNPESAVTVRLSRKSN